MNIFNPDIYYLHRHLSSPTHILVTGGKKELTDILTPIISRDGTEKLEYVLQ